MIKRVAFNQENNMEKVLKPICIFIIGLVLGALSRFFDIYTQNLGNIFSQFAIWILIGTVMSIYSKTKKKAMLNVLVFCIGMLITYYLAAFLTRGVYSGIFIIGWSLFALCSPIMAYFAWLSKEKGLFPKIICVGIVLVSFLSSVIFFDRLRAYDFIINVVLIYFLFIKKIERQ